MVRKFVSRRASNLPLSTIIPLLKIAAEDCSVISLGPGEPDFVAPKCILDGVIQAVNDRATHYSPISGRSDFKQAVIGKLEKDNKIRAREENIITTCGSTEALYLALMAVINPRDKVIVPDPGFLAYRPMVEILDGRAVSFPLKQDEGFEFNPDLLERLVRKHRPKVLILNTPSNPTGTVLRRKTLAEIGDLACEYDFLVYSDEAYEHFVYGKSKHYSLGSFSGLKDRVLTFQSFSKTFAMPGFRLGYAVGREDVINSMKSLHVYTSLAAPTIGQVAAVHAFKKWGGVLKTIEKMRVSYDRRRKMVLRRVSEIDGLSIHSPEGAFYAFPRFDFKMSSLKFSEWLLKEAKVAVLPGTEFGIFGEGFIRMSYATKYKLIEEAFDRVERALKDLH